jgi:hypothetical protein
MLDTHFAQVLANYIRDTILNLIAVTLDNPWNSLWHELTNAEWVADVGLPLVVALTALLFAYRSLRAQIASDRELSRAEYRAATARVLGASLNRLVRVFESSPPRDPWWSKAQWDGFGDVCDAIDEAEISLVDNEAFEHILDVAREIDHSWKACHELKKELLARPDPPRIKSTDNALLDTLEVSRSRLKEAIASLMRWDGFLPIPMPRPPGNWKVPLPEHQHRHEYEDWRQRVQADFQTRVNWFEDYSNRHELRRPTDEK